MLFSNGISASAKLSGFGEFYYAAKTMLGPWCRLVARVELILGEHVLNQREIDELNSWLRDAEDRLKAVNNPPA